MEGDTTTEWATTTGDCDVGGWIQDGITHLHSNAHAILLYSHAISNIAAALPNVIMVTIAACPAAAVAACVRAASQLPALTAVGAQLRLRVPVSATDATATS